MKPDKISEARHLWIFTWLMILAGESAVAVQTFVREPSDQHVTLGQNVVLPCQVAEAVGHVQWTRDEFGLGVIRDLPSYPRYQMMGDDAEGIYSLQIQRVSLEDDATFQCQAGAANGQNGIRSRNAQLMVLVPPDPPRILQEGQGGQGDQLTVSSGDVITIQCESHGAKPPAEMEWTAGMHDFRDQTSLLEVSTLPDGKRTVSLSTLSMRATDDMDDVTITCRAHNAALSAPQTTSVRLSVRYPPRLRLEADRQVLREMDDVNFICHTAANPLKVSYRWWVAGALVPDQDTSSMTLTMLQRKLHGASVRCEATNEQGTTDAAIRLNIIYGPQFSSEPIHVSGEVGTDHVLTCPVDSNPPAVITWSRVDCPFCPTVIGVGGSVSVRLTAESAGVYACHVNGSGFPPIVRRLRVDLMTSPRVKASTYQYAVVGESAYVECQVTGQPAPNNVTWYHDGLSVRSGELEEYRLVEERQEGALRSLLVISQTSERHLGTYNCSFRNDYGRGSALVVLRRQKAASALVTLSVVLGGVLLCVLLVFVIIMYQRQRQLTAKSQAADAHAAQKPGAAAPTVAPVVAAPALGDSSGSDLKLEIRTGSPGSDWTTEERRWSDGPGQVVGSHVVKPVADDVTDGSVPPRPPAPPRYRESTSDYDSAMLMRPWYEGDGYMRTTSAGGISRSPPQPGGQYPGVATAPGVYDDYARPPLPAATNCATDGLARATCVTWTDATCWSDPRQVVDAARLKPGTLATHV